jgi:hypothetical protein
MAFTTWSAAALRGRMALLTADMICREAGLSGFDDNSRAIADQTSSPDWTCSRVGGLLGFDTLPVYRPALGPIASSAELMGAELSSRTIGYAAGQRGKCQADSTSVLYA